MFWAVCIYNRFILFVVPPESFRLDPCVGEVIARRNKLRSLHTSLINSHFLVYIITILLVLLLCHFIILVCRQYYHGSHQDWKSAKTWKNGKAFSSQGKVREFCQDWKSQGILLKILEKSENIILEN